MRSIVIILVLIFWVKSGRSQSLWLKGPDGRPVVGAIAGFSPVNQPDTKVWVSSDFSGGIKYPVLEPPMIREVMMLGYQTVLDTVWVIQKEEVLVMKSRVRDLGEVTVTGNFRAVLSKDAAVKVDIIHAEEFAKRGAVNLKDVLSRELNMRVGFDPALGSSLTLQGTGGEHVKILIDGVPVVGRQNGNIDLGQLNLGNVDRIEIVRGPQSVLYGNDALGGVINLISKTPAKEKWTSSSGLYYESIGNYNAEAFLGWSQKTTSFSVQGGRNFFDGWNPPGSQDVRSFLWNPREQYNGQLRLTKSIKGFKTTAQGIFFNEKVFNRSEPVITPYFAYGTDQIYRTNRTGYQLSADKQFTPGSQLSTVFSYSRYRYTSNTYRKDLVSLTEQMTSDPMDDDTTFFGTFFMRSVFSGKSSNNKWMMLGGLDINQEKATGSRIEGNTREILETGLFASLDFKPSPRILLRPSARLIYNSRYGTPVVPGLHFKYDVGETLIIRASASRGYRSPSLKEMYLYFVDGGLHNIRGNRNLTPETSWQFQTGLEWKKAWSSTVLTIEPGCYFNRINDRISLLQYDQQSTLYTYMNLGKFTSKGAELKSSMSFKKLNIRYGVSLTGLSVTLAGDIEQPNTAWYPEHTAGLDYKIDNSSMIFSVLLKRNGRQPVYIVNAADQIVRSVNEGFTMLDASVNKSFMQSRFNITVGVKNIFNVTSIRATGTNNFHSGSDGNSMMVGTGITYFTKLSYSFK